MNKKSDSELIALARRGDKHAFGELVERYQQMAERIALGMVANPYLAQELAQETMLQAYLSLEHLHDDQRFRNWLYGITLNVCRNYIRHQKIDFCSLEALMGGMLPDTTSFTDSSPDPQAVAEERELYHTILAAIHMLSPGERAATLLFYYEQYSLREIAAILGISTVAVKGRLHKARQRLKQQLLPSFEGKTEVHSLPERNRIMVKMSIIDVVSVKKPDADDGTISVLVLLDETGHRALGIWIGKAEAAAIDMGLCKTSLPRPMTMNFMANILQATGATLEEVRIATLKDDIFYATASIRNGQTVQELDARPSDAIALAVVTGSPVYAAEEVLEKAAVTLPEGKTLQRMSLDRAGELAEGEPESGQPTASASKSQEECFKERFQRVLNMLMA